MSGLRSFLILSFFLLFTNCFAREGVKVKSISEADADSLARIPVLYRDRVVPFHTVAKDIMVKLTGKTKIGKLNEVQFVVSLLKYPSNWAEIPLFKIKDKTLADSLGIREGELIPISLLFNSDMSYKLTSWYGGTDKGFDKAILDLDEKVEIILMLRTNSLYSYIDPNNKEISDSRLRIPSQKNISLEIFFNKVGIVRWLFMAIFTVAAITLLLYFFQKKLSHSSRNVCVLPFLDYCLLFLLFIPAAFNFIARWIIGGHIPLAGGEQVMMFMSMLLIAGAIISKHLAPWISLASLTMSGFTALVARLSASDPIVTGLSPALDSPWLAFHVSIIMASYTVFAIIFPLSLVQLFKAKRNLTRNLIILNIIGEIFLGIGIILGSLWAKGAWGSYWSWDPKENWAAVTFFAYLIPLCFLRYFKKNPKRYSAVLILAFLFMIVTYFGVNYMSSLHSYGN